MNNIGKLMKQAQHMQAKMARLQEELAAKEFEVSSGGGMVRVRINGKQEVLGVAIDPEVFKEGDREMLEDLIMAALTEARQKVTAMAEEQMSGITGGVNIPGLF